MIEVARKLPPETRIIFKTLAPRWLYECYFERPLEFHPLQLDVGVIQQDSLSLDGERTLEAYAELLERLPGIIEREIDFARGERVSGIVADIPPAAFEIAAGAGVPSVALTNFSWDWIYAPYVKRRPEYAWLVEKIRQSYAQCDLLLRLPFHGDLSAFPTVEDTPLVVREPELARQALRRQLGLEPDSKVVLLSFGGFDLERIPWERVERMKDYRFIYFRCPVPARNVLHVANGKLPHVDIVRTADVVLSKPGYGICAECIRTQTPIVYTDRGEFPEYEYLVEGLQTYARSLYVPQGDLLAGNWERYLEEALRLPAARQTLPMNGAAVAAARILALSAPR